MIAQYIGCTIYFHSSKRYSTIHFAPTSSWNVPSFCGWHQPVLVRSGMPGNPAGRAMGATAAGIPEMGLAVTITGALMSSARSAAMGST